MPQFEIIKPHTGITQNPFANGLSKITIENRVPLEEVYRIPKDLKKKDLPWNLKAFKGNSGVKRLPAALTQAGFSALLFYKDMHQRNGGTGKGYGSDWLHMTPEGRRCCKNLFEYCFQGETGVTLTEALLYGFDELAACRFWVTARSDVGKHEARIDELRRKKFLNDTGQNELATAENEINCTLYVNIVSIHLDPDSDETTKVFKIGRTKKYKDNPEKYFELNRKQLNPKTLGLCPGHETQEQFYLDACRPSLVAPREWFSICPATIRFIESPNTFILVPEYRELIAPHKKRLGMIE